MLALMMVCAVAIAAVIVVLCVVSVNSARKSGAETREQSQTETESTTEEEILTVVIDPGHGFVDSGCSTGLTPEYEKYYTVLYAKELQTKLAAMGINAILSHDGENLPDEQAIVDKVAEYGITFSSANVQARVGDSNFDKYERVMQSAVWDAEMGVDFFISIHFNSAETAEASGPSIYYCQDNPHASVLNTFCGNLMNRIGGSASHIYATTFESTFVVAKYTSYPSVLFEVAYLTNQNDANNVVSDEFRNSITTALAESIAEVLGV